jgi:hypothetical protein
VIYPTRRAVFLAAFGIPVSLAVGIAAPGLWLIGIAWLVFVAGAIAADALLGA